MQFQQMNVNHNLQFSFSVHLLIRLTSFLIHRHVKRALDDIVAANQSEAEKVCPGLYFRSPLPLLNINYLYVT